MLLFLGKRGKREVFILIVVNIDSFFIYIVYILTIIIKYAIIIYY